MLWARSRPDSLLNKFPLKVNTMLAEWLSYKIRLWRRRLLHELQGVQRPIRLSRSGRRRALLLMGQGRLSLQEDLLLQGSWPITNWYAQQIAIALKSQGYAVDHLDETKGPYLPDQHYDLLLHQGENAARWFAAFSEQTRSVILRTQAEPFMTAIAETERIDAFMQREAQPYSPRRALSRPGDVYHAWQLAALRILFTSEASARAYYDYPLTRLGDYAWRIPAQAGQGGCVALWAGPGPLNGIDLIFEAAARMPEQIFSLLYTDVEAEFMQIMAPRLPELPNLRLIQVSGLGDARIAEVVADSRYLIAAGQDEEAGLLLNSFLTTGLYPLFHTGSGIVTQANCGVMLADASPEALVAGIQAAQDKTEAQRQQESQSLQKALKPLSTFQQDLAAVLTTL